MMRRWMWVIGLVGFAGCGADSGTAHHDAAIDSPPPLVDAPPPPLDHYYFVVDKVNVPTTSTEARADALDLDGDGAVDNQFGMVLATLSSMGFPIQPTQDKAIDTGAEILLGDLYTTDFATTASSTFTLYQGSNPMPAACANAQDTTCRHHLTGTASFTALAMPVDPPLVGMFNLGVMTAGPGHLSLQLAFPDATPVIVTLVGAKVALSAASATAIGGAILAGGITHADADGKIVPALQMGFMAQVTRDCSMLSSPPGCGCIDNSSGKTAIGLFDTNHDCAISIDEVRNNSLIVSLLAPDLTLEGQMCLSFGVRAHAVPAGFVAP